MKLTNESLKGICRHINYYMDEFYKFVSQVDVHQI